MSINRWMDKKDVVYICNGTLLSHKKEWNYAALWMDLEISSFLSVLGLRWGTQDLPCGMWDLVPWTRIEPGSPALEAQGVSHWTTRPQHYHLKWNKSGREQQISYDIAHMWNVKRKWYRWAYLQERNRFTDIANTLTGTKGDSKGCCCRSAIKSCLTHGL